MANLFKGLMIAGAVFLAPLSPAFADRDGRAPHTYESYKGAREHARKHARKVRRQERGYRAAERKRLARVAVQRRAYRSPWGPFAGPPGLF